MKLSDKFQECAQTLEQAGIENARHEAMLILQEATGWSSADLLSRFDEQMELTRAARAQDAAFNRTRGMPFAYLWQNQPFFKNVFVVRPGVFIPRPETELLVETALALLKDMRTPKILDLGTGTGAILLSILAERADSIGYGIDISRDAIDLARENALRLGLENRSEFFHADFRDDLLQILPSIQFDLIVSNPPYVSDSDLEHLPPEVKLYEPPTALRGGSDGLNAYRSIAQISRSLLRRDGKIVLEIGYGQQDAVQTVLEQNGFMIERIIPDLSQIPRVILAQVS